MEKICKQCNRVLQATEFYRHRKTSDGYLGKCKECHKAAVRENRAKNIDKIREYDRARGQDPKRKKENKRRYKERTKTPEGRAREWARKKRASKIKRAANILVGNAIRDNRLVPKPCQHCGATPTHGHHEDYFSPMDVTWLCLPCHGKRHREINQAIRNGEDWSDRGF